MSETILMSLVETLFWYQASIKEKGREEANKLMHKATPQDLWRLIERSTNDVGEWLNGKEELLNKKE
jgi:hypothetical protein